MMEQTAFSRDLNPILPVFLLLSPILFLILKRFISCSSKSLRPPLPPGPRPWPIIGNILQIGRNPHISMAKFAQLHGPLISLKIGFQLVVIGSSPSVAAEILKTHDRLLSARWVPDVTNLEGFDLDRQSLIWSDCTDRWKFLRALCRTELFSSRALESTASIRERKIAELVDLLNTKEGQVVKIVDVVSTTVYNSVYNLLCSRDFCCFENDAHSRLKEAMLRGLELVATPNLSDLYPVFARFDLQGLKKQTLEIKNQLFATWEDIIKEKRECIISQNSQEHPDFMDILIAKGFADDQINFLIWELFTAGTDTITTTVEWTISELLKNKEAMEKACKELTRETSQEFISESHLSKLPYLLACVMEALRLNPPLPLLLHRALETCQVMNYTIPKDTLIFVNLRAIGRDPAAWEDPLSFKPERFLHSKMNFQGQDFEYLPFGSGRRMCPGYPLATKQVLLLLANLLHRFDWHLPNNEDPEGLHMGGKFGITLHKEKPLCLIPTKKI